MAASPDRGVRGKQGQGDLLGKAALAGQLGAYAAGGSGWRRRRKKAYQGQQPRELVHCRTPGQVYFIQLQNRRKLPPSCPGEGGVFKANTKGSGRFQEPGMGYCQNRAALRGGCRVAAAPLFGGRFGGTARPQFTMTRCGCCASLLVFGWGTLFWVGGSYQGSR